MGWSLKIKTIASVLDGEAALGDEDKELDPEPPTMNNIEDAADLEDGGVEKPKDPDETSL